MPRKTYTPSHTSLNFDVELVYLSTYGASTFLDYLHSIRSGVLDSIYDGNPEKSPTAVQYKNRLSEATEALASELEEDNLDVIVSPPSERNDVKPYKDEIKQNRPDLTDLSRLSTGLQVFNLDRG